MIEQLLPGLPCNHLLVGMRCMGKRKRMHAAEELAITLDVLPTSTAPGMVPHTDCPAILLLKILS